MKAKLLPPAEIVRSLFNYDRESGRFTWATSRVGGNGAVQAKAMAGSLAGSVASNGYRHLNIGKEKFLAHRIAWLLVYGEPVPEHIDHINQNKDDNSILNLRSATKAQNSHNAKLQSNNTSGHRGIIWDKNRDCWQARLGGKHLGRYKCLNDAISVYEEAVLNSPVASFAKRVWSTPSVQEII